MGLLTSVLGSLAGFSCGTMFGLKLRKLRKSATCCWSSFSFVLQYVTCTSHWYEESMCILACFCSNMKLRTTQQFRTIPNRSDCGTEVLSRIALVCRIWVFVNLGDACWPLANGVCLFCSYVPCFCGPQRTAQMIATTIYVSFRVLCLPSCRVRNLHCGRSGTTVLFTNGCSHSWGSFVWVS